MKGVLIGCGACLGLLVFTVLGVVVYIVSTSNKEVRLRNEAGAQQKANEAIFDNVWKTIAQQANVKDDYKDDFRKVWQDIVQGQASGSKGSLNVFVNRFNPNFDSDIYKKLMNTIEGQRKEFLNNERKLIDIKREHDNLRQTMPSSLICGGRPEIEIKIVTSGRTQDVFESGKEDDINLRPQSKGK